MNNITKASLIAALVTLAACGTQEETTDNVGTTEQAQTTEPQAAPAAAEVGQAHSGTGEVASIAGNQVTISHEEIRSIGWPAMQMTFTAADASQLNGIKSGDRVTFAFRQSDGTSTLTSISKQ